MAAFPAAKKKKLKRKLQKQPQLQTSALRIHQPWLQPGSTADKDASTSTDWTTESVAAAESSANEKDGDETPAGKYSSSSRMEGYVYVEVNPDDNCTPERDIVGTNEKRKRKQKKLFDV